MADEWAVCVFADLAVACDSDTVEVLQALILSITVSLLHIHKVAEAGMSVTEVNK